MSSQLRHVTASAMTIPSALTLLVHVFQEPLEQARAMGIFGGCGASADSRCWSFFPSLQAVT